MPRLQELLLQYTKAAGSMKGNFLRKIGIVWRYKHDICLQRIKECLKNQVKLAYLDRKQSLCMFTDARDLFYGIMLTQIPNEDVGKPFEHQKHSPHVFLSGNLTNSQLNWSKIENEAYPIVVSLTKLQHFCFVKQYLGYSQPFLVFNPSVVKKALTDRLFAGRSHRELSLHC
jgi:hypothetical protein